MTIYIDDITQYPAKVISREAKKYGDKWCHLWTDGNIEELINFAKKIGLKESWLQKNRRFPHFDLVQSKRKIAIENGAIYISLRDWYRLKMKEKQNEKRILE